MLIVGSHRLFFYKYLVLIVCQPQFEIVRNGRAVTWAVSFFPPPLVRPSTAFHTLKIVRPANVRAVSIRLLCYYL